MIATDSTCLATRLQRLLDERGLSISEAARMSGLEKQRCWLVVTGRNSNPTWKTLHRLVTGVGGSFRELFDDPAQAAQYPKEPSQPSLVRV